MGKNSEQKTGGDAMENIFEYLETAYVGANMLDDFDGMARIGRAIAAAKAPANMEIFTDEFKEWYNQYQTKDG